MAPEAGIAPKTEAEPVFLPQADINPAQLLARIKNRDAIVLLDSRPPREFLAGHLPGAKNIPLEQLPDAFESFSNTAEIVVYDRLMERSRKAVRQLGQTGLKARALSGGIAVWAMAGYQLEASPREGP